MYYLDPGNIELLSSISISTDQGESRVAGIAFSMGEAPAFFVDELQKGFANGFDVKSKGGETSVAYGNRTYVIGGACEESALSIGVRILDQSSGEWINPTVLGTKPKPSKGHSAVLLGEDRILITKNGSSADDFAWFLEVDTQYVRQQKKILGTEVVAWSKGVRGCSEKPVVISGPSGVGKGTLISMLMKEYPSMFGFSVSHTTRAARAMEKDGVHYHFIERSIMEKELEDGKFLEFASVHGNLYGTSVEAVELVADDGKVNVVILCSLKKLFLFYDDYGVLESGSVFVIMFDLLSGSVPMSLEFL
ncbi:hypothetical protein C1H46_036408 [Malus baccata]|uniref:Guanylate kinase-like domain-containing protein n=1 Tax=Malus baccata TaxID=106549 RepID=A0A540KV35_MALBA|nr:hypothetical protein C1H46_036408 [Malus baccata]